MGFVIYGIKQTPVGIDEFLIKCPSCETHSFADIMVLSSYVHFYFIPFFPTEKEANIICKKCGLKRRGLTFDQNLISNFIEVKNNYKHPWFTYIGATIIILFIAAIIITSTT